MKTGWIILGGIVIVGGAGAYYYYKQQIKALQRLDFKIIGYKIISISENSATIQLTVRVTNPSVFEVQVQDFYVDVYLNNEKISNLVPVNPFIVPSKNISGQPSYNDANIIVNFSPRQVFLDALGLATDFLNKKDLPIRVVGSARLKSSFITLTVPVEYDTTVKELLS